MNRIEFINRTCMDDMVRKSVLEFFWDQFMLVCELSDSVEEVVPIPIAIDTGKIAFQLIYADPIGVENLKRTIDYNNRFVMYERQFIVRYQVDTRPNIITIMID